VVLGEDLRNPPSANGVSIIIGSLPSDDSGHEIVSYPEALLREWVRKCRSRSLFEDARTIFMARLVFSEGFHMKDLGLAPMIELFIVQSSVGFLQGAAPFCQALDLSE